MSLICISCGGNVLVIVNKMIIPINEIERVSFVIRDINLVSKIGK